MKKLHTFNQCSLTTFALLSSLILVSEAIAQPQSQYSLPQLQVNVTYPPTDDQRGSPPETKGSGSRGGCQNPLSEAKQDSLPVTALMPSNSRVTTVKPHPTIYLYVPQTSSQQAEFVLYDWTNRVRKPLYQAQFSISNASGIMKVNLPESVALQPGSTYVWQFHIICDPNDRSRDQYTEGALERINLTPQQQAKIEQVQQQPLVQAQLYANAGVWSETLEIVEQLRESSPNSWEQLLQSVGLSELAQQPILDCCSNSIQIQSR